MQTSVFHLLKERRFVPFFLTQFLGTFNDNAFKLVVFTLISYHLASNQAQSEYYQALASALFLLPFLLFSATAGQVADKYDKSSIVLAIKISELFLMIIGSYALFKGSVFMMMLTLTGLGIQSTFFVPIKHAILPEHLPPQHLLGATGLIDASTFIAILLGTIIGTLSVGTNSFNPYLAVFLIVTLAIIGLIFSLFIPRAPAQETGLKIEIQIWKVTYRLIKQVTKHGGILLAILVLSWFWLLGTVFMTKLPDYTHYVLGANNTVFVFFLALFSIGMATGSMTVNVLFKGRINLSTIPLAILALAFFYFDIYWVSPEAKDYNTLLAIDNFLQFFLHWRISFDFFMLAFSSGLFVVPLYTYLQVMSPPESRARILATNNIYNALFMTMGALTLIGMSHLKITIPHIFFILSLANIFIAYLVKFSLKKFRIASPV